MLHGVDVSNWQGPAIDWHKLRAANVEFAAIKATEGINIVDSALVHNWQQSKQAEIVRLGYHYLRPAFNGADQAHALHKAVKAVGGFKYGDGVMLDLEEMDQRTARTVLQCAEQFVLHCRTEIDKQVVLYTARFFVDMLGDPISPILQSCPLWVASWGSLYAPTLPNLPAPAFWQYSSTGLEPGIDGQVDLDLFLGSRVQLHRILTVHP